MATTTADPITPERFRLAIADLPFSNLYAKAAEITNSIGHLKSSNEQMLPFAEEGDQDCKGAMFENLSVIGRMNGRMELLRAEVERRGGVWMGGAHANGAEMKEPGEEEVVDGIGGATNGTPAPATTGDVDGQTGASQQRSGRLTDEELRRQLEAQMADEENEDGVHL